MHACQVSSVVSTSSRPHGQLPTRLLCPWGFSRQEHWSELPCPPPGDLPDPGIKPTSLMAPALQVDSLPLSHWGSPLIIITTILKSSVFIILKIHSLFLFKSKPSEKLKKKKIKICLPLNHCGPVWDFTVQ